VVWMMNDFKLGDRVRKSIGGWRNADVQGAPLAISGLSDEIVRLAETRAVPEAATLRSLLDLINCVAAPPQGKQSEFVDEKETSPFEVPSTLFTVADVIKTPSAAPDEAGLYAWWFDDLPLNVPLMGALEKTGFRLAYIGIASHRPGSRRTLRQRLRNHCNGPIATSTLRRSLAAILLDKLELHPFSGSGNKIKLPQEEEERLSQWLATHGRVAWIADATPWIHEAELLQYGPPVALNIRGNAHEFVPNLLALRSRLSSVRSMRDSEGPRR
jgi:hypothetical protein